MAFCSTCGAQIPDGTTTCAACAGRAAAAAPTATAGGMTDNMAGTLAYVTFIPAIVFLVMEPYNKSRFVRFHSFQCLFLCAASFLAHIALMFVAVIPFLILLTAPLHLLVSLATIVLLIVCALKANQGQMYKLPVIGDMAEKQANAM
jgi:uncharacterized membrane protein